MKAKEQYQVLLDSGELFELFPNFKGDWEKDKKEFIRYFKEIEFLLNDLED